MSGSSQLPITPTLGGLTTALTSLGTHTQLTATHSTLVFVTFVWLGLLVGLLTAVAGAAFESFADFWKSIPCISLPCPALIQGEVLSLTETLYAMFC